MSRAGFYAWRGRGRVRAGSRRLRPGPRRSTAVFARSRHTYGSPRVVRALCRAGHACGRRRVAWIHAWPWPGRAQSGPAAGGHHRQQPRPTHRPQPAAPESRATDPARRSVGGRHHLRAHGPKAGSTSPACSTFTSRKLVGWSMAESLETSLPMERPARWPSSGDGPPRACSTTRIAAANTPARLTTINSAPGACSRA